MKKHLQWLTFVVFFCAMITTVGCSRKATKSTVSFQFPAKVSGSSTSTMENVIINVSGGGSPLRVFNFECDEQNCNNINVEVDSGDNKLIQLLVITENNTLVTDINYGQVITKIAPGDNTFTIPVNKVADFSQEGRIEGRYIPQAGHPLVSKLLTGEVVIKVRVGADVPDMRIMKFEMFGGWFSSVLINSVVFRYEFTGFDQFGNFYELSQNPNVIAHEIFNDLHGGLGMNLQTSAIQESAPSIYHFTSLDSGGNLNQYYEQRDNAYRQKFFPQRIVGFFGEKSGTDKLCAKNFSGNTELDGSGDADGLCKNVSGNNCDDYFRWSDITGHPSVNGSGNSCIGNTLAIELELARVIDNRGPGMLGRYGPFKRVQKGKLIKVDNDGPTVIKWKTSPSVFLPKGYDFFYRENASGFNKNLVEDRNGGFRCEKLSNHGFNVIANLPANVGGMVSQTLPSSANSSSAFAICPKKPSGMGYYSSAIVNDGGSSEGPGAPARLAIFKSPDTDGFSSIMYNGTCQPVDVEVLDNEGRVVDGSQHELDVTININASNGTFYLDSNCSLLSLPSLTPANIVKVKGKRTLWYEPNNSTDDSFTASATIGGGTVSSPAFSYTNPSAAPAADVIRIVADFYRARELEVAKTEDCVPFHIFAMKDIGGGQYEPARFDTLNFDLSGATKTDSSPVYFYDTKANCELGSTPGKITSAQNPGSSYTHGIYWLKVPSEETIISLNNLNSSCEGGTCPRISVVEPGEFDHIHVESGSSLVAGFCTKVLGAYDDHKPNSYPVNIPSDYGDITYAATSSHSAWGRVHTNSSCSADLTGTNIAPTSTHLYRPDTDATTHGLWYYSVNSSQTVDLNITHGDSQTDNFNGSL